VLLAGDVGFFFDPPFSFCLKPPAPPPLLKTEPPSILMSFYKPGFSPHKFAAFSLGPFPQFSFLNFCPLLIGCFPRRATPLQMPSCCRVKITLFFTHPPLPPPFFPYRGDPLVYKDLYGSSCYSILGAFFSLLLLPPLESPCPPPFDKDSARPWSIFPDHLRKGPRSSFAPFSFFFPFPPPHCSPFPPGTAFARQGPPRGGQVCSSASAVFFRETSVFFGRPKLPFTLNSESRRLVTVIPHPHICWWRTFLVRPPPPFAFPLFFFRGPLQNLPS